MFINIVIGVIEKDEKILLVKRQKGNFQNLWGLPGGKVEDGEHLDNAIEREIEEETEFKVAAKKVLGLATEIINDENKIASTVIYCLNLSSDNISIAQNGVWTSKKEGLSLKWFSKEELMIRKDIVGSDLIFLNHFYYLKDKQYVKIDCIHYKDGSYTWNERN